MTVTRDARKAQITACVYAANRTGKRLTAREIATGIGIKKTPYLEELLNNLLDWGILHCDTGATHNGLSVRLYSVTDHPYVQTLGTLPDAYIEDYL